MENNKIYIIDRIYKRFYIYTTTDAHNYNNIRNIIRFKTFDELVTYYKTNIKEVSFYNPGKESERLSKDEREIILNIYESYKDLI
jgi:hypothetical protein